MNATIIGKQFMSWTLSFLLTSYIYNHGVHNCLVDSRVSSNIMPYYVCKNISSTYFKCSPRIIQLDTPDVKVTGELKDVMILLASIPKVYQVIDSIVFYIPTTYVLLLRRDLSQKLLVLRVELDYLFDFIGLV